MNDRKYLLEIVDNFSGETIRQILVLGYPYDIDSREILEKRVMDEARDYYQGTKIEFNPGDIDYNITHFFDDEILDLRKEEANE